MGLRPQALGNSILIRVCVGYGEWGREICTLWGRQLETLALRGARGLSSILRGRAIRTRVVVASWVQRRHAISPAHTEGESTSSQHPGVKCPLPSPLPSRGNPDSCSLKETHLVKTRVTSLSTALSCSALLSLMLNCLCNGYHCCSQTVGGRENLFYSQFPGFCQVYRELGWNTVELVGEEEGRKQRVRSILGVRCNPGEHILPPIPISRSFQSLSKWSH